MNAPLGYSIAIPAYGRPHEYSDLLESIYNQKLLPNEVIVCEDNSKERPMLKEISDQWQEKFHSKGIEFNYVENEVNLGYDANVRKLIELAKYKWVILIGNDDLFLKDGIEIISRFCFDNPDIAMVSRPFVRFNTDVNSPIGESRIFTEEQIVKAGSHSSKYIFRICGFVGGLIVNKNWADKFHTKKYDGTLFYQIYLASHAFCTSGIGYLSECPIAGRADNPPLFGEAGASGHIPGSYSAKGRADMWRGVLTIAGDVGPIYDQDLKSDLKAELMVRQSFHVFEMNASASKHDLKELKFELGQLDLFNHWIPKSLYTINYLFGNYSKAFYYLARKLMQRKSS